MGNSNEIIKPLILKVNSAKLSIFSKYHCQRLWQHENHLNVDIDKVTIVTLEQHSTI